MRIVWDHISLKWSIRCISKTRVCGACATEIAHEIDSLIMSQCASINCTFICTSATGKREHTENTPKLFDDTSNKSHFTRNIK